MLFEICCGCGEPDTYGYKEEEKWNTYGKKDYVVISETWKLQ